MEKEAHHHKAEFEIKPETEKFVSKVLVVKIGSSSITRDGNPLNDVFIDNIARQASELFHNGVKVAIVSSGAVACGRAELRKDENTIIGSQKAAMFGQLILFEKWKNAFHKYNTKTCGALFSEPDLKSNNTPVVEAMEDGIPILNANDAVNDEEMKRFFVSADNDKLAKHIAKFVNADTLALLSDVDGVLDTNGDVIDKFWNSKSQKIDLNGKSKLGTGGMKSKVKVARKAAQKGIRTVIANAYEDDIILKIAKGELVGTVFDTIQS